MLHIWTKANTRNVNGMKNGKSVLENRVHIQIESIRIDAYVNEINLHMHTHIQRSLDICFLSKQFQYQTIERSKQFKNRHTERETVWRNLMSSFIRLPIHSFENVCEYTEFYARKISELKIVPFGRWWCWRFHRSIPFSRYIFFRSIRWLRCAAATKSQIDTLTDFTLLSSLLDGMTMWAYIKLVSTIRSSSIFLSALYSMTQAHFVYIL